jgi:hypothetical protein
MIFEGAQFVGFSFGTFRLLRSQISKRNSGAASGNHQCFETQILHSSSIAIAASILKQSIQTLQFGNLINFILRAALSFVKSSRCLPASGLLNV